MSMCFVMAWPFVKRGVGCIERRGVRVDWRGVKGVRGICTLRSSWWMIVRLGGFVWGLLRMNCR